MAGSPDITPRRKDGTRISRKEFLTIVGLLGLGALEACTPFTVAPVVPDIPSTDTPTPSPEATATETPTPEPSKTPEPTATATEVKPLTLEEEMKALGIPLLPGKTAMAGEPNSEVFDMYLQDHNLTVEELFEQEVKRMGSDERIYYKNLTHLGSSGEAPATRSQLFLVTGIWALPLEGKELFNGRSGHPGDFALVLSLYNPFYPYVKKAYEYSLCGVLIGAKVEGRWSPLTNFSKEKRTGEYYDFADDGSVPKTPEGMVTALRPYVGKHIGAMVILKYPDEQALAKAPASSSRVSTAHINKGVWDAVLGKGGYIKELTEKAKGRQDVSIFSILKDPEYYGSFGFAAKGIFLDGFVK